MTRFEGLDNISYDISKVFGLTEDILLKLPIINVFGNKGVSIENYNKLKVFNDEIIVVETKIGDIKILGERLYLEKYCEEEVLIRGNVLEISLNDLGDKR